MSNFPTVMNPSDLSTALAGSQVQATTGLVGMSFLKMDFESGDWMLGQDADDVTDELVLVNTTTIQHGWVLWSGGRPAKNLVGFTQGLPMPMESIGEDHPSEARAFQGALVDDGEMLAFETSSYGGRKGVDTLLGKVKAHATEGSQHLYPKVRLTSESYPNKKRGGKLVFNPIFEIVAWCDQEGKEEGAPATQIEAPNAETGVETPEPEATADAPTKRQRRKRNAA